MFYVGLPCSTVAWFFATFIVAFSACETCAISFIVLTFTSEILEGNNGEKAQNWKVDVKLKSLKAKIMRGMQI